jgi:hypothetical protein
MKIPESLDQLYLHIFIGSMVLIKDFYGYFDDSKNPAERESQLAVEFMGYFTAYCAQLAGEKGSVLVKKVEPLLTSKIRNELAEYLPKGYDAADTLPKFIAKYHDVSADDLLDSLEKQIGDETISTHVYAAERVRDIQYESVPFKDLVSKVEKEL